MLRFILQRLALIALVLVTIVFAVNLGMLIVERNAVEEPSESVGEVMATSLANTRDFFSNVMTGDLGDFRTRVGSQPVNEMLRRTFIASLGLMLLSAVISAIIGVLLGITVALTRIKGLSFTLLTSTIIGLSVPSFFAAMLLQQTVINIFRETGTRYLSVAGFGWDYQHMLLPILVLIARPIAYIMRTSYIVLERTMQEEYIRTAYSKGLSQRYVVNIHALRNVAVPILTAIGVSWRFSLGILPVVEFMFGWPGMGLSMLEGINTSQLVMVVPIAAIFGLILLSGNLLLDILYRIIDPRLREAI
jgi:ABC-type dipeptide/oligopeptide/nickel transport system permease component